ncbi:MAG: M48 family metallopeptidase [Acidobacteriaceae bacterium]
MDTRRVGRGGLLLGVLVIILGVGTGVARAVDPTPDFRRTPTEARALSVAEGHLSTAYRLPADKLQKAKTKARINHWLHFGGEAWGLVQVLLLLGTGAVAWMQRTALRSRGGRWVQGLVFLGLFLAVGTLLDLPMSALGHHVSRVYGMSVQGWGSWAWDQTKAFLLGWLIGWPVVMLLFWVIRRSPRRWWLWFWAATIPMVLLGVFLVPMVIEPMFNHFEPLSKADPALVTQLQRVVDKGQMGITPDRMFLMKASEKVTGMNAYVTGFGASKRVVVWDTTIAKATPEEILFIFGHEMGHYVLRHIVRGLALAIGGLFLSFGLGYLLVQGALRRWGGRWGIGGQTEWGTLAVLVLAMSVYGVISEPVESTLSRVQEHEADVFGQEVVHGIVSDPQRVGREAFQVLGETSLDEPEPSALLEFWSYSHPSISRRAAFAEAYDPWSDGSAPRYFGR